MILKFTKKKKSVIYSWIASYILLIMIPVIATGIIYYIAKNTIEEEINSSNELLVGKLKDNMDNTLSDIERFSAEVAYSKSIQNVLAMNKLDDDSEYYSIYQASKDLSNYKIFNSTLKRFYVYFNNLKMVITPGTVYNQAYYYNGFINSKDYSMEKWLDTMNKSYRGDYLLMPYFEDSTGNEKTVGFVRSLPIPVLGNNFSANLVILLDLHVLLESGMDENGMFSERSLLIMDKDGLTIAGAGSDKEFSGVSYDNMNADHGSIIKTINGRKVVVSYTTSRVNGWKYIIVTPEAVFWEKAKFIRNIMVGGLFLCIVLGGALSFFFLRKNYNPLKEVVAYFHNHLHSKEDYKSNEYSFLTQAFNETLEQKETIRLKLEQQNKTLKSNFIEAILKGRNKDVPVHELMTTYNMSFKYSNYTVMAVYIESLDEDFWNKDYGGNIDNYSLSKFIITNVIEELVNRNFCGYMAAVDDIIVCLVNLDSESMHFKKEMLSVINEARDFIEQNYKIQMAFALGSVHNSFEGITAAYVEAINTMEYSKVMGINDVVFYEDIELETENSYYYPIEKEYQLINCIKAADFKSSSNILEEIFQKNFVKSTPSLDIARCLMFDLTSTLLKTASEIEKTEDRGFIEKMNPVGELLKCKTFLEMKSKMLQILENACEYISQKNEQTNYRVRDKVMEIIENNYNDPGLSIASIADQVGNHPNYISRVFKDQTGEGILECISRVRVNHAKELIKENLWNQEEIALKVGYTSVRTFQRAFKKHEGTSPGKMKM